MGGYLCITVALLKVYLALGVNVQFHGVFYGQLAVRKCAVDCRREVPDERVPEPQYYALT